MPRPFTQAAERRELHLGRYLCRFWDLGRGPTIVFIHGMNDVAQSFAPMMLHLADRFRCLAYELPNASGDGAVVSRYTHADYADDLIRFCDRLELVRPIVFGSSFGSTITLAAAARHPERFTRIAVQGGFARRPLQPHERQLARLARWMPGRMRHMPGRMAMLRKTDYGSFAAYPPDVWHTYVDHAGRTPIHTVARRALLLDTLDLRPELSNIRVPLLMIGGDRDELVPRSNEEEVRTGVAGAQRVEFAPCGHFPQYVRPVQTADALVAGSV